MSKRVIISGGGTGGHIFPAVAIANALKDMIDDVDILFVGANGRMEMKRVPEAGYKIVGLNIYGLQRKLTVKNILENLKLPFRLWSSMRKARQIIKDFQPHIAIGVGGYASGPTLKVAAQMGIPTLIHEANSYPGVTNKILGNKVDRICITYDTVRKYFPEDKIIKTGNPIRKDILTMNISKAEALQFFGLEQGKKTLAVIGGSLGALTINNGICNIVRTLQENNIQLIWQTGERFYNNLDEQYKHMNGIKVMPFVFRMDMLYTAADVVISRAGALSLSELCTIGKPCILIPSPNVAEDHQTKNAKVLADKKAAIMIPDAEVNLKLGQIVVDLFHNDLQLETMHQNLLTMSQTDAAKIIVDEAIKLMNRQ